ncbi:MAG: DNA-directed RNA polymerase [archaeon]
MSYKKYNLEAIVCISPLSLSGDLDDIILEQLAKDYEGVIDKQIGLIVCVNDLIEKDIGEIVPGDSNVFYRAKFSVVSYLPKLHEITYGEVSQATEFGAFIKIGPIEGLCHISQVMEDFNSYNADIKGFSGKESKRSLVVTDKILTRIANVSLKTTVADTKVGLTMRQFGLGKEEWQKSGPVERKSSGKGKGKFKGKEHRDKDSKPSSKKSDSKGGKK